MSMIFEHFWVNDSHCSKAGGVFGFQGNVTLLIRNVTATNVDSQETGGVFSVDDFSSATVTDVVVVNASAKQSGAVLIVMNTASANITNMVIRNGFAMLQGMVTSTNSGFIKLHNLSVYNTTGGLGGVLCISESA
eukprot:PhF_6_TR5077/c0_g1_i6/m.7118